MKKDQAKILAIALYKASMNKKGKEVDTVIANFSSYLAEHHLVAMIPSILAELEKMHFQVGGIVAAKVQSNFDISDKEVEKIVSLIKSKTNKQVVVRKEKDEDLIGGAIVRYDDKIIDLSIKNQLNNLAKQLSN